MRRAKRRRSSGSRLFRYDRGLGFRWVAGADEAGRGCLAGPLVAAAVLFDYESLTLSDLRSLSALNDSKQHTPEMREALYPKVLRAASRVAITSRCVRGIDERGLHKTNLAALSDVLRRVGQDGALCLSDGFPVPPTGFEQRAVVGGRRDERRDRRRVRDREGHPRPLHASHGGALSGVGVRRARRLLDARAPGGDRAPGGLAAAPDELPVDGVPAARALGGAPPRTPVAFGPRGRRDRRWPRQCLVNVELDDAPRDADRRYPPVLTSSGTTGTEL